MNYSGLINNYFERADQSRVVHPDSTVSGILFLFNHISEYLGFKLQQKARCTLGADESWKVSDEWLKVKRSLDPKNHFSQQVDMEDGRKAHNVQIHVLCTLLKLIIRMTVHDAHKYLLMESESAIEILKEAIMEGDME